MSLDTHAALIARELDETLGSLAFYLTRHLPLRKRKVNREREHERLRLKVPVSAIARDVAKADFAVGRRTIGVAG